MKVETVNADLAKGEIQANNVPKRETPTTRCPDVTSARVPVAVMTRAGTDTATEDEGR